MTPNRLLLVLAVAAIPFPLAAQPAGPAPSSPAQVRESLRLAERALGDAVERSGFSRAMVDGMTGNPILLVDGAPILQGREPIARTLAAQTGLTGARLTWMPYRVLVSGDGGFGITFGATLLEPAEGRAITGRYISAWRRTAGGAWRLAACVYNGAWPAPATIPEGLTRSSPGPIGEGEELARADRAFARLAGDSGAPLAFARFIAPDGITFAGTGEVTVGPASILARMGEGRAATAAWHWEPVFALSSSGGDLGVTVGEADLRFPEEPEPSLSKYLTVWQRQPDGSLRFVVDGGNGRPPR